MRLNVNLNWFNVGRYIESKEINIGNIRSNLVLNDIEIEDFFSVL